MQKKTTEIQRTMNFKAVFRASNNNMDNEIFKIICKHHFGLFAK